LWGLKFVEKNRAKQHRATLFLLIAAAGPSQVEIADYWIKANCQALPRGITFNENHQRELNYGVKWQDKSPTFISPKFLTALASQKGVLKLSWQLID
jgi:hypothetical protein